MDGRKLVTYELYTNLKWEGIEEPINRIQYLPTLSNRFILRAKRTYRVGIYKLYFMYRMPRQRFKKIIHFTSDTLVMHTNRYTERFSHGYWILWIKLHLEFSLCTTDMYENGYYVTSSNSYSFNVLLHTPPSLNV